MQRINSIDGLFHEGNPASGQKGTKVTEDFLNSVQEEIANVIEATGVDLDAEKSDQMVAALRSGKFQDVLYASQFDTLAEADAVALAAGRKLIISTPWAIPVAHTFNAAVEVIEGGTLDVAGALNIFGPFRCRKGGLTGTGSFYGLQRAYIGWWATDGVSDQVQINQAIQSLVPRGILYGSADTFIVDGRVWVNKDDVIIKHLKIKIKDNASPGTESTLSVIESTGNRVQILNCYIDGNRANQSWVWSESANYGISITGNYCIVRGNYVTGMTANSMGVPANGTNNLFEGNVGTDAGKKGFYGGAVSGLTIKNNFFFNNANDSGIGLRATWNSIVEGNHCFGNGTYGIHAHETVSAFGGGRVIVANNFLYNNTINNLFISQYWDAPAGYYDSPSTNPNPTQAEWDATGLDEAAVENSTIVAGNHLFFTVAPAGGVARYNIEVYNAKNTWIFGNFLTLGGVLLFNSINTEISHNDFLANYPNTNPYLIRMSGYACTGSHPNHLIVKNTKIKDNRFELGNVTNAIYMDLTTGTEIADNDFQVKAGGTYEIRIMDDASISNTTINQKNGRIRLGATTYTAGYKQITLTGFTTATLPALPAAYQIAFDTTKNKPVFRSGASWLEPVMVSAGAVVASAAVITPTGTIFHVSGTAVINTINLPYAGFIGSITIIPDGAFTTTAAGGNIGLASVAVVGKALQLTYDGVKWYPSY